MKNKKMSFIIGAGVVAGLVVFFLLYKQSPKGTQQTVPATKQVVPSSNEAIKTVVSNFYTTFQDCMVNPPVQAAGFVSNYCQTNTGFTTSSFSSNFGNQQIVTCSQNPPESISVGQIKRDSPTNATAIVIEKFGSITENISVTVKQENGSWKVDNVICPSQ